MKLLPAGSAHPGGLALQEARRLLVAEAQLQPHAVRLHQPVQDAEAPAERVVARVPDSGRRRRHAGGGPCLQEEPAHLLAEPAADDRATGENIGAVMRNRLIFSPTTVGTFGGHRQRRLIVFSTAVTRF